MVGFRWCKATPHVALLALVSGLGACSFEHAVAVDYEQMITKTDGGEVRGIIHAETWSPAFFYVLPILPYQSPERAKELAVEKAKAMGADAITDVRLHVETHMPFFFLAGWTENHISATAVSYK